MAAGSCKFTLHIPRMWKPIIQPFDDPLGEFGRHIDIQLLSVSETGISDQAYRNIPPDTPALLHVLMLPVAHCALNMDDFRFKVVGPAIATRNDIFVFKARQKPEILDGWFIVGTKEVDLTSSNIFRIVMANWPDDMLFFSEDALSKPEIRESVAKIKEHILSKLKCETQYHPEARLDRLRNGEYHAAVFMGEELGVGKKSLFRQEDIIDVLNLNRRINSLYHVRSLPRAVLCIRNGENVDPKSVDDFVLLYNKAVGRAAASSKVVRGADGRQQVPLMVGPSASEDEIETLIRFTQDMHSPHIKQWRRNDINDADRAKELRASRELRRSDFTHWNVTYRNTYQNAIVEGVRRLCSSVRPGLEVGEEVTNLPIDILAWLQRLPEVSKDPHVLASGIRSKTKSLFPAEDLLSVTQEAIAAVDQR
jgi:hypothetical protein